MEGTNRHVTTWRKSSHSAGNNGNCVEVGAWFPMEQIHHAVSLAEAPGRQGKLLLRISES